MKWLQKVTVLYAWKKCLLVVYILHIYAWIHIFSSDLCSVMLEAQRHLSSIQAEKYITNNLVPCAVHKKLKLPAFHICIGKSTQDKLSTEWLWETNLLRYPGWTNELFWGSLLGSCHWYETSFSISSSIDSCSRVGKKSSLGINNAIGALLQTMIPCLYNSSKVLERPENLDILEI